MIKDWILVRGATIALSVTCAVITTSFIAVCIHYDVMIALTSAAVGSALFSTLCCLIFFFVTPEPFYFVGIFVIGSSIAFGTWLGSLILYHTLDDAIWAVAMLGALTYIGVCLCVACVIGCCCCLDHEDD